MLKIGDFSRLCQISIKSLRRYDDLGLIRPEHVDKFTGYRYYTLQQLPRAHRIMALKEMGLSLEQVGIMLNQEMSVEELRGMFRLKQAEIEQRVREDQQRLAMIEFHINMINAKDKMPEIDLVVKDIEPFNALFIKFRGARDTVESIGDELYQTLTERKIKWLPPSIDTLYGDEINPDDFEFAIAIPVDASVTNNLELPSKRTLILTEISAVRAVTLIHEGGDVQEGMQKKVLLQRWAIENGYTLCNEMRAVHFKGPMHDVPQSEFVAEMQVVVEVPE